MHCTFRYADGTVEEHDVQLVHRRVQDAPDSQSFPWEQTFPDFWTLNRRRLAAPFLPGTSSLPTDFVETTQETVRFVCRAFRVRDESGQEAYFHEYHEESACPGPFCQCGMGPTKRIPPEATGKLDAEIKDQYGRTFATVHSKSAGLMPPITVKIMPASNGDPDCADILVNQGGTVLSHHKNKALDENHPSVPQSERDAIKRERGSR